MTAKINPHWNSPEILEKYKNPRPWEKRFKSEKYFLEKFFKPGMSVLDVGCATGDLYHGLKERFGNLEYSGLDGAAILLKRARELAPEATFVEANIFDGTLKPDQKFDLVTATGVFQHEPRYEELLQRMVNHTKEGGYILFDLKFFYDHPTLCDDKKSYGDWGQDRVYFNVLNFKDFIKMISGHADIANKLGIYGYYSGTHASVRLPESVKEEVCSAHVLLQKGKREIPDKFQADINLPDEFMSKYFN